MKLARPYRRAPLELATLLAAKLVRDGSAPDGDVPGRGGRGRPAGLPQRPRASRPRSRRWSTASSPSPTRGDASTPLSTRSVNVEFVSANPTGPLTIGNARGAFIGDLLSRVLEAGGQQRHARVLLQRLGGADRQPRRVDRRRSGAASPSPRTATTATTSSDLAARRPGRRLGGGRRAGRRPGERRRALGGGPGPRPASRRASSGSASTSTSGRREALAPRGGLGRARGRAAARARPRLRAGRRRLVPIDRHSATTRIASSTARTASRPTSRPTSATSPRSSAGASTT